MANELTVRSPEGMIPFEKIQSMAEVFFKSGMFMDVKSAYQATVKIMAGQEIGIPPIVAMTKIYIVKGKVAVGAELLGAMVKRSGRYDYHVTEYIDTAVTLVFTDQGKDVFTSRFTMDDARKAGLIAQGGSWEKFPRAMLMSKALSQGARIVAPECISGVYTPEDFNMTVNPDSDQLTDVITGEVVVEKPLQPTPNAPELKSDRVGTSAVPKSPEKSPEIKSLVDLEWLKQAMTVLQYDPKAIIAIIREKSPKIETKGKDLVTIVSGLDAEQAKYLVDALLMRADVSGKQLP